MGRQCKKRRGSLVRDKAAIGAQVVDLALEGTTGVDSVGVVALCGAIYSELA